MYNKLAIVIPAYKTTFFRKTLESIALQTDKRFTLYIGDDCSPYDLNSIVDDFRDRIEIVYHRFEKNLGGKDLVAHWERCIALTKDEPYIWLFSDDDVMDSNCVESYLALPNDIKKNSLVHFNIRMIDDTEGGIVKQLPMYSKKMTAGEYLEAKLSGKLISFVVEFVFSRNLYNKVNGFQNFDLAWGADFMTWLKMAANCPKGIITINEPDSFVNWRKSGENISPNKTKPILIRKINSLIGNAAFIKNQMESFPEKYNPLNRRFRWLRFPLGEIYRNRNFLTIKDIRSLCKTYSKQVGYPLYALGCFIIILCKRS